MRPVFRREAEGWVLEIEPAEREVLESIPTLVETGGDAGGRLDYSAHPDDPDADARYRELLAGELDALRAEDRGAFERVVAGEVSDDEGIAAFMRVVGEARLVLASRVGIEHDGWEGSADHSDPRVAMLGWLGFLQETAVGLLLD